MTNTWWDNTFNEEFRAMAVDGYCFKDNKLNAIYEVAQRMFYQNRIHIMYTDFGGMEAIYQQYCGDIDTFVRLDAANKAYPLEDMKSALNMMMIQAGTSVVDNAGHLALTRDNDFKQHIKYIGGLDEW